MVYVYMGIRWDYYLFRKTFVLKLLEEDEHAVNVGENDVFFIAKTATVFILNKKTNGKSTFFVIRYTYTYILERLKIQNIYRRKLIY